MMIVIQRLHGPGVRTAFEESRRGTDLGWRLRYHFLVHTRLNLMITPCLYIFDPFYMATM